MRIKYLSHGIIREGLRKGRLAAEKILKHLKIGGPISIMDLYGHVIDDLEKMKFDVVHDGVLFNMEINDLQNENKQQSVVSIIFFNEGKDKKAGGLIKLNPYYPAEAQIEAIFHEYIHIMEDSLPVYSTANNISTDSMFEGVFMRDADIIADLITYTLIMPPREIKKCLRDYKYNIDEVLSRYKCLEQCTVLQWIVINSLIPCHFSWSIIPDGNKEIKMHYDNCYYDRPNNPENYDIDKIINIPYSSAFKALDSKKNTNNPTIVGGKEYQCYAYYQSDLRMDISNAATSDSRKITTVNYDRLLVIGWEKNEYDKMVYRLEDFDEMYKD